MQDRSMDPIVERYLGESGKNADGDVLLDRIEAAIGVRLPSEFRRIAGTFRGGRVGDFEHALIAADGPKSIVAVTSDFRGTFGLAENYVALGGPKTRLTLLETRTGTVIVVPWHSRHEFTASFPEQLKASGTEVYPTYFEFFASLLTAAATEERRKQIRSSVPQPPRSQVKSLRERWNEKSRRAAHRFLLTGGAGNLPFPPLEVADGSYADLRGMAFLSHQVQRIGDDAWYDLYRKWLKLSPDQQEARRGKATAFEFDPDTHVQLTNVDLSHCVDVAGEPASFSGLDFQRSRFVGSRFPQWFGHRFVDCDFSAAQLKNCNLQGECTGCRFVGADFTQSRARAAFQNCDFSGADFRTAHWMKCAFDHCVWDAARFGFGSLAESRFVGSIPSAAILGDTVMERTSFV